MMSDTYPRRNFLQAYLPLQGIILLFLLVVPFFLSGQEKAAERGYPFIRHYSSKDYNGHTQNFCCLQDQRGLMYIGNFAGILEFDGVSWRLIQTTNQTRVTALAMDAAGTIFAGAFNEAGYLATGPGGQLQYKSLTMSLKEKDRDFGEVMECFVMGKKVFFVTPTHILTFDGGKLSAWKPSQPVLSACMVKETLYIQLKGKGLMYYQSQQLVPVAGGAFFSSALEVKSMFDLGNRGILLATDNQGFFLLNSTGIEPWKTEADVSLLAGKISCAVVTKQGQLAIGTQRKGIYMLTPEGHLMFQVSREAGLGSDNVTKLFVDRDHTIWASLNDGISHVGYPSPFTYFSETSGLEGGVLSLARHQGTLVVATYQGLYRYQQSTSTFAGSPGILTACFSVLSTPSCLVAATSQGLYVVGAGNATKIAEGFTLTLHQSKKDPTTLFAGQTEGLLQMKLEAGTLRQVGMLPSLKSEIREIAEDGSGAIWLSGPMTGIIRYDYLNSSEIHHFDTTKGIPVLTGLHLNQVAGKLVLSTPVGPYSFFEPKGLFEPGLPYKADSNITNAWYYRMLEDSKGNLWTTLGNEKHLACNRLTPRKTYSLESVPFLPISDVTVWTILPESNGITWFGGPEGLIQYDPSVTVNQKREFTPLIRKVLVNNDSLLFSGSFPSRDSAGAAVQPDSLLPVLSHLENTLLFEFAAPVFDVKGETKYQYMLEGFDKLWSDWTNVTQKEYTNLPKGSYVFKVRAKDIYGVISKECSYAFRIKTPWYSTILAYVIYGLLALGILLFIIRLRSKQLLKEKKSLENMIQERTLEVVQKKEEIEQQSLELAHKNEELERINTVVKSINAQIHFSHLLQSILEKLMVIKGVERATAIVNDKSTGSFKVKAGIGWDFRSVEQESYKQEQLEQQLLEGSDEVSEDIYLKTADAPSGFISSLTSQQLASLLIIMIRLDDKVEGILTLENSMKKDAFNEKDISFLSNLRQHIISAFIKTGLLEDLQKTLDELKDTQDQLVQSEKLASLGQLTAGIAHEIQNPLNFVNNFSTLSADLATELKEHLDKLKDNIEEDTRLDMEDILNMIDSNVKKINEHGKRAESIVKGMLQHSRGRTGEFELTDINNMVSEYVNLAYHGMRAKDKSFNTAIKTELDPEAGKIYVVPQDLSRVILNIMNNSCYAVDQKAKTLGSSFRPEISVTTKKAGKFIEIRIHDNGTGIPASVLDKIFNPFFTTKPTGKGTGLGLSMSFDIIKQIHKGKLEVKTEEGQFTEFIISIPENPQK